MCQINSRYGNDLKVLKEEDILLRTQNCCSHYKKYIHPISIVISRCRSTLVVKQQFSISLLRLRQESLRHLRPCFGETSESKDAHYLVASFVVISAEDEVLLRPGSRCVVETGVG